MRKGIIVALSATVVIGSVLGFIGYKNRWFTNKASEKQFNDLLYFVKGGKKIVALGENDFIKNKDNFLKNINKSDATFLIESLRKGAINLSSTDKDKFINILSTAGLPVDI